MTQPSIFDRLRSMQTEGLPLHTLIVEACEVGNGLAAAADAAFYFLGGVDDAAVVRDLLRHALNRAYSNSNGNGSNGSNRSAA